MKFDGKFHNYRLLYLTDKDRRDLGIKTFVAGTMRLSDTKENIIVLFPEFEQLNFEMQAFVLAHEVGHIMSHPDTSEEAANDWAIRNFKSSIEYATQLMKDCYLFTETLKKTYRF